MNVNEPKGFSSFHQDRNIKAVSHSVLLYYHEVMENNKFFNKIFQNLITYLVNRILEMDSISKNSEQYKIAKTIYNEARGEGYEGMAAVASTILNRKKLNRSYWGGSKLVDIVSHPS
jgi:hypothetical protein